jgi:hypothetical protein
MWFNDTFRFPMAEDGFSGSKLLDIQPCVAGFSGKSEEPQKQ